MIYEPTGRNGGTSTVINVANWFSTNSVNCKLTYQILWDNKSTFNDYYNRVRFSSDGSTLLVTNTNGWLHWWLYIRARSPSGIVRDRRINVKICYNQDQINAAYGYFDQTYYNGDKDYGLNSYNGKHISHTITYAWFTHYPDPYNRCGWKNPRWYIVEDN